MGIVYIIGDRNNEGTYKIGVTRGTIEKRLKKLQTGSPGELYLVDSFKSDQPFILERMLHNKYKTNHIFGEWYNLSDNEVINFTNTCESLQEKIDFLAENNIFFKKEIGRNKRATN